jgi:two-component system OmpR family sensor kinase
VKSLRGRLLLWLLSTLALVGILAGGGAYFLDREEVDSSLDAQLRQIAVNIGDTRTPASGEGAGAPLDPEDALVVTIWDGAGNRRTSDASVNIPRLTRTGFANVEATGEGWRSYALVEPGRTVQVSQRKVVRDEFATNSAWRAVLPVLALVPILALLVSWLVGRAIRPIHGLTAKLRRWNTATSDPLPVAEVPEEILPLVLAMNDLIARLHAQLEFRRQFISDAAHEMRTPLAALRLQVNNLRTTGDEAGRTLAIGEMVRGLRRTSEMVSQLLDLARAEAEPDGTEPQADLRQVISGAVEDVIQLANEKAVDLGLITPAVQPAIVAGDAGELRMLLKNLLDNAIRYTASGGQVDIALEQSDNRLTIEVRDTGRGIPPALLDRVFDRFFRADDSQTEGSGLGLAIVRAIADRSRVTVTLRNRTDRTGLVARVSFQERRGSASAMPARKQAVVPATPSPEAVTASRG